ncbi:hypothetical protein CK203_103858 [Vitis vinifera]|uniref:Uncharacterized protein n=1 Tax=Vitis vinifera TaxID=29760 RepID=A0A438C6K3_VITVI|nr:hypothetical protein CK203_103858 [Vitis vinifera]
MEEAKTMKTPMSSSIKLDMDEKGTSVNSTMYRGMIGERQGPPGLRASALLRHLSLSRGGSLKGECRLLFLGDLWLGGPVLFTVRGVEIRLSPESICRILNIPSVGLRVYEAKAWPLCRDSSLERLSKVVWTRLCPGDGQTISTQPDLAQPSPSSHDLLHLIATRRTSRRGLLP